MIRGVNAIYHVFTDRLTDQRGTFKYIRIVMTVQMRRAKQ